MKAYTFVVAPVIADLLIPMGYDTAKLGNAVESHGNDNLKIVDTSDKSSNGYRPQKTSASGKIADASSTATNTKRIKLEGDGSPHRQFAAWHDDTVKMIGKYGSLIGCPLPVVLKTWLDAKFKGKGKVATIKVSAPRATKPAQSVPILSASPANSNGVHPATV